MIEYIFYREEGFYFLQLNSDEEAIANAKCNPGTKKVMTSIGFRIVWEEVR